MSSLDWPNVVLVSARRTLRRFFSLSVYVISVFDERQAFVVCHSEFGGYVGVGYECVVECYCGLYVVFFGLGCN